MAKNTGPEALAQLRHEMCIRDRANSILKFKVTATAGDNSEVKQVTPETREFQGYPATATKTTKATDTTTPSTCLLYTSD